MSITLGSNIASLRAQQQLASSNIKLGSVFERLSSGQRINRASDDAAGLAIADSLNADSRVYAQGVRNLNDGISILNIADGALQELTNIAFRLVELAEQAANGSYSSTQREALDTEAQALGDEYFRIAKSTEFNGRKIFEGDYGKLNLLAGYGVDAVIGQGLGGAIGDGTFGGVNAYSVGNNPKSLTTGDFNGDGVLDLVSANVFDSSVSVLLGSGDGTFRSATTFSIGNIPQSLISGDFNGDGVLDLASSDNTNTVSVLLGNGDGTFGSTTSYSAGNTPHSVTTGDFNGDGVLDLVSADYVGSTVSVLLGSGDGTFGVATSYSVGNNPLSVTMGDFNGDGELDLTTADSSDNTVSVLLGNGDGTFGSASAFSVGSNPTSVTTGDLNGDGVLDLVSADLFGATLSVLLGSGNGTFGSATAYSLGTSPSSVTTGDFNGDGVLDLVSADNNLSVLLGNGDGTFGGATAFSVGNNPFSVTTGDFNGDGVLDLASADNVDDLVRVLLGTTTDGVAPLLDFSLETIADAKQALSQFAQKLDQLSTQRGTIGAFLSRIEVAERVLGVSAENFRAAESRIRDADVAQESASLARLQILQQASASVLAQANQQPALALQLLSL